MQEIYLNIAGLFYPKSVDSYSQREQYLKSPEFKRLVIFNNRFKTNGSSEKIVSTFSASNVIFSDKQSIISMDRCLTLEHHIYEKSMVYEIKVNISYIFPVFCIEASEITVDAETLEWKSFKPIQLKMLGAKYSEKIEKIVNVLENQLHLNAFPKEFSKIILPRVSFESILSGKFTLYNAFFKNDKP